VKKWAHEEALWRDAAALGRHPTPHRSLGKLAADAGDWELALRHLETAKELAAKDPYAAHDPTLYESLAQVARKLAAETVAKTTPKGPRTVPTEGRDEDERAGKEEPEKAAEERVAELLETAEDAVATGLREGAPDPGLLFELGKTQYKQGRFQEAETSLRQALDLDPEHFQALTYLAMVVFRQGRAEEAEEIFLRSLEVDASEKNWLALSNLGKVYQSLGRFSEAAELALRWARLAPRTQVAHQRFLEAVAALAQQGNRSAARGFLDDYRETFPQVPQAKLLLAQLFLAEGDLQGAEPLLAECLTADPENKWIQQTLAQVRQQLGR
jgi:Flp pilus assembly protein TadD